MLIKTFKATKMQTILSSIGIAHVMTSLRQSFDIRENADMILTREFLASNKILSTQKIQVPKRLNSFVKSLITNQRDRQVFAFTAAPNV